MTTVIPGTSVSPAELRRRLAADENLRVVDVRTPGEFESVHIRGSYNVPLDLLAEHTHDLAERMQGHVVLICQSGPRGPGLPAPAGRRVRHRRRPQRRHRRL